MIAVDIRSKMEETEALLCGYFNRRYCFLVQRGTTALYLALRVLERTVGRGDIIVPTMACAALAQVIHYSGFRPVFADVCLNDCTLDVASVQACLTPDTRGILPVHLFGHAVDMDAIMALASAHKLAVIEDAAQAIGGRYRDRMLGAIGDMSILSFGGDKIVSAGGGGAITTDNHEYAAILAEEVTQLPPTLRASDRALMSLSHRNLYHALLDLLRIDGAYPIDRVFMEAIAFYQSLYVERYSGGRDVLDKVAVAFSRLAESNEQRVQRAAHYDRLLVSEELIRFRAWERSTVLWRYSFLVKDPQGALRVTEALRRNGIHASNHYWSVADLFHHERPANVTSYICPRIVNLWVDAVATEQYVQRSCEVILHSLQAEHR